jgi:hypothetical protein
VAGEGNVAGTGPEHPVAKVEADAPDLGPCGAEKAAQPMEPGPVRTLQEEEAAGGSGQAGGPAEGVGRRLAANYSRIREKR